MVLRPQEPNPRARIGGNNPPEPIHTDLPGRIAEVFFERTGAFRKSRYKVLYGGRGAGKTWAVALILIGLANALPIRVLCCREFQNSISDSVHRILSDAIGKMGLSHRFAITDKSIKNAATGAEFFFKGLRHNINGIKSIEGVTHVWVEEAQTVSKASWQILRPTIRTPGSEIWITFNPDEEAGATFQDFVIKAPRNAIVQKVNWDDNPWFPAELEEERLLCLEADQDAYEWIWNGEPRRVSDAIIFRNRVVFEPFEEPPNMRPFYGMDFGFANDPSALVRSYIVDVGDDRQDLYITDEAFGYHVEMDDLPEFMDRVPGVRDWPIKGDCSRPETISYLARRGFNISSAEKWPGSVEDGITHLKGFRRIVVHPRCEHISREFRLYSYKVDPRQLDGNGQPQVLPIIVDKWNHGIDGLRYSLDGYIMGRGGAGVWRKLAG